MPLFSEGPPREAGRGRHDHEDRYCQPGLQSHLEARSHHPQLIDTDFYKLLMLQMIWKLYPDVDATFSVINRTKSVRLAEVIDERSCATNWIMHALCSFPRRK